MCEMATTFYILLATIIFGISLAVFTPENNGNIDRSALSRRNSKNLPCPQHCYCSSRTVQCSFPSIYNDKLYEIPENTETLSFNNWPRKSIDGTFLENSKDLVRLRLNKGKLVTFPGVKELKSLSYLDISDNFIESLPAMVFPNNSQLTQLNISGNSLKQIHEHFFIGLDHLRVLDLSRNPSLLQIPSASFSYFANLRFLDLSSLGMTDISTDLISHLQQLIFLNISHNELTTVPQLQLSSLEILDASYNEITTLPKLAGLIKLRELYLSHTHISYLNAEETEGCNKLEILDISYANLTNINENVLSNCKHFKEIDLSHNYNLYRIEHRALSGLTNLTILRLNNCPALEDLEENVFSGLNSLKELHLQNSGVQVLPTSLGTLQNLTYANLDGTSLRCDCYAHWFPVLLNSTLNYSSWKGINPIQCEDGSTKTLQELSLHLKSLDCEGVTSHTEHKQWILAPWNQSALLECNVTGNPRPTIVWQTVEQHLLIFNKSITEDHPWLSYQITEALSIATAPTEGKYQVLQSGQLLIRNVKRKDIGRYKCFAFNSVSNTSVVTFLGLQDTEFRSLVLESMLFGFACSALFLFITLLAQFIKFVMERLGWECCCCRNRLSPKAKQIRQLIESVESYKTAQLDRLKDNYNSQVVSIKDSCYSQMEKLRDSYSNQSKNLKDLCDYSTQQISGARDQYVDQVNKVRDYSMGQMNRVHENYVFQRHRIRKFSGHQLLRLRETYKYQQKTLNKLLETLPDLYIQNCRSGSCQRTDSMIFDEEIDGLDIYYKVDFLETQSFNSSNYYTPASTLTRQAKGHKGVHSRDGSSVSGNTDYQEDQAWIQRQGSSRSDKTPSFHKRYHARSFSLATTPTGILKTIVDVHQKKKNHQRSSSASSHPCAATPLKEEHSVSTESSPSKDTPLYTPPSVTPVYDHPPSTSSNQPYILSPPIEADFIKVTIEDDESSDPYNGIELMCTPVIKDPILIEALDEHPTCDNNEKVDQNP